MNFSRRSTNDKVKRVVLLLCVCLGLSSKLDADVIYLSDGSLLLTSKAWEEGGEIRYTTSDGVRALPKSKVLRIQEEKNTSSASFKADKWGIGISQGASRGQSSTASVLTPPSRPGSLVISNEALAKLRGNLRADPTDIRAKSELVYALHSVASLEITQGDFVSARDSLEEALSLDQNNPVLLSNLAMIHIRLGDSRTAEDLLLTSLKADAKSQWTHYLLGEAYYDQEKITQAISEWTEALTLGPNPDIAKRLEKAQHEAGAHDELAVLQSAHFILRYDQKASDYRLGQDILGTLEDLYNQLSRDLTSQAPATVAVILYPNEAYFDITQAPSWTGALFDGKIRVPTRGLASVTTQLRSTLTHELTHSFMASLPGRGSPTWFLEGIAQFEEGKSAVKARNALIRLRREDRLLPLNNLRGSFMGFSSVTAAVAYAESLSAVEYLASRFGRPSIRNLLDLMAQNYNFENAFQTALHENVSDFEADWQNDLVQ